MSLKRTRKFGPSTLNMLNINSFDPAYSTIFLMMSLLMDMHESLDDELVILSLDKTDDLSSFNCKSEELNDFLKTKRKLSSSE